MSIYLQAHLVAVFAVFLGGLLYGIGIGLVFGPQPARDPELWQEASGFWVLGTIGLVVAIFLFAARDVVGP